MKLENHGSPNNPGVLLDAEVFHVCRRCGACCKWPGDVRLEDREVPRIAAFLGLTEEEFVARHTRLRANRQGLSLLEKDNHECGMLDGDACRIHPVKPDQCAGFPNRWNFPGWREICQAVPVPVHQPVRQLPPALVEQAGEEPGDLGEGVGVDRGVQCPEVVAAFF